MPRLSAFTPCGLLRLAHGPSAAELIYRQLCSLYASSPDAVQKFDLSKGTHLEASIYARAMALARALVLLERAGDQADPLKAYDLIPLLELDYELTPGANDNYVVRQKAIAAAKSLVFGGTLGNIVSGLKQILGSDFLSYKPAPARTVTPASLAAPVVNTFTFSDTPGAPTSFSDPRSPTKFLKLLDPVVNGAFQGTTGGGGIGLLAPLNTVRYAPLDPNGVPVSVSPGEIVIVGAGNTSVMERVKVQATSVLTNPTLIPAPSGTPAWSANATIMAGQLILPTIPTGFWFRAVVGGVTGGTEPSWTSAFGPTTVDGGVTWVAAGGAVAFSACFFNAHDAGCPVISGNWPYWWSTQRHNLVIVTSTAAINRDKRRKVDEFMRRITRGVSTWAIVSGAPTMGTSTGTVGGFSAGMPMGTAPLGTFTYLNS